MTTTKATRTKQLSLLKNEKSSYGGELLTTRKARSKGRPLAVRDTMHLVLRSTKAKGAWSFKTPKNQTAIKKIVGKFSEKYAVKIISLANVGNHLHFQIKLFKRHTYRAFIRAITSAIAMAVSGVNRWSKSQGQIEPVSGVLSGDREGSNRKARPEKLKFWDYRPFTRIVKSFRAFLTLKDYILINEMEGFGIDRRQARFILQTEGSLFGRALIQGFG